MGNIVQILHNKLMHYKKKWKCFYLKKCSNLPNNNTFYHQCTPNYMNNAQDTLKLLWIFFYCVFTLCWHLRRIYLFFFTNCMLQIWYIYVLNEIVNLKLIVFKIRSEINLLNSLIQWWWLFITWRYFKYTQGVRSLV